MSTLGREPVCTACFLGPSIGYYLQPMSKTIVKEENEEEEEEGKLQ